MSKSFSWSTKIEHTQTQTTTKTSKFLTNTVKLNLQYSRRTSGIQQSCKLNIHLRWATIPTSVDVTTALSCVLAPLELNVCLQLSTAWLINLSNYLLRQTKSVLGSFSESGTLCPGEGREIVTTSPRHDEHWEHFYFF